MKRGFVREFVQILTELKDYRELLFQLTLRDIRIRYKQAVMGFGWAVFMPMLIVLSGMVVRFAIAYLRGDELQTAALGGIAVKALPWAFFVGAIGFANASLIGNSNLVTKIYFPREVLPLSAVVAQAFDTLVGATALVLVLPFLGAKLSVALLWLPLLALILFLFTAALALFLSCANLFFRDVKYLVQTILLFGIFFTPVFFEPAMLGPTGAQLMMLNPLGPILEGTRLAVVEGHNLLVPLAQAAEDGSRIVVWTPWHLAYSTGWATLGFGSAALLFHRLEFLFAEYA